MLRESLTATITATAADAFALIVKEEFDGLVINLESSEDLYKLIAGIPDFQPGAMLTSPHSVPRPVSGAWNHEPNHFSKRSAVWAS